MDPNEALRLGRAALKIVRGVQQVHHFDLEVAEQKVIDAFEVLDEWISNGGFLPDDWQPKPLPEGDDGLDPEPVF